jgi:hypothetical protein
MNNINQDIICTTPLLDSSLFPVGTATLHQGFDMLPFLCQLMTVATNSAVDPLLVQPPEFDPTPWISFNPLTAVGDPRFSDGAILSSTFVQFLPKIITQIEVAKAGGTQIINGYICDADGTPKQASNIAPIQTTVGTGGINLYGFDIPSNLNFNDLLTPITSDAVFSHIDNFITDQKTLHAQAFVQYLATYYPTPSWQCTLFSTSIPPFFYVQLDFLVNGAVGQSVYLKYHYDAAEIVLYQMIEQGYVSNDKVIVQLPQPNFVNNAIARAYNAQIADYLSLIFDSQAAINTQLSAVDLYSASPNDTLLS